MKSFLLYIVLLLAVVKAGAQDTLSGQYENLSLTAGTHLVKGIVSVNGSLEIAAGATLLFDEGASLICYRRVQLNGNAVNRITFQSMSGKKANGLVIRGADVEASVRISHTRFSQLVVPLRFEGEWYRKSVSIEQSEFINNKSPNSIVYVMPPRFELGKENPVIDFKIVQSVFSGNESPIYFEDLTSDNLKISIADNVFMANRLADYGVYNFSGNIIFGRADTYSTAYQASFSGNSFLQNYLLNLSADTVLLESTIGVYGTFDSLNAANNFWGYTNTSLIRLNIYDYYTNYNAPKLYIEPFNSQPGTQTAPHVYRVLPGAPEQGNRNSANILLGSDYILQAGAQSSYQLFANRAIRFSTGKLIWRYLNDSLQMQEQPLRARFVSAPVDRQASLEFDSAVVSMLKKFPGYFEISGLSGENEEFIPSFYIGYRSFLRVKKLALDKDRQDRLRSTEPDRPKTNETALPPGTDPVLIRTSSEFIPHQNIYFMPSVNSSSQTIDDVGASGQFIYPVDQLTTSDFSMGGGAGFRWVNHYTKRLSYGAALTYTYLRPAQTFLNTDSITPFTGRFVGFVPRKVFHFVGLNAFGSVSYSDLRFTAGGVMELNLSPFAPLDTENFNSYRDLMWSLFAGVELEFDPFEYKNNDTPPGYLLGIRYRRGFPMLSTTKVLNTTDMIEFYVAAEIKRKTKRVNKLKSAKK